MNNIQKRIAALAASAIMLIGPVPTVAATPAVDIAQGPLFSGKGNVHPNMLLNLSVEYPTVGAAYRGTNDYNKTTEYLGYFNPKQCYTYPNATIDNPAYAGSGKSIKSTAGSNGIPLYANIADAKAKQNFIGYLSGTGSNVRSTNATDIISVATDLNEAATGNAYFSISKAATNHECGGDSFSGNFMNWASSSSIDMLRYAMTGGDRTTDTATLTVLQRAWLPDGTWNSNENFYPGSNNYFPRRTVTATATMSAPNQVTPFNTTTLYVVSCRNRILFSNTDSSTGTSDTCVTPRTSGSPAVLQTTDKYFGEYLVRVKVCGSVEGPTRTDLCQKYGSNYKPEGDLQRNSDKLRVGALGYLTEHDIGNNNVYGSVVRGPVKYVGPKKFDSPSFSERDNDKPEWNAATGEFYNNPEDPVNRASATNSGVINYLNKFGRTNTSRPGAYKTWDPVGELYYEALRYLQGKQPTAGSTNGTDATRALGTDTLDDNFPALKTWSDPVTASCQNNYIVTIGDVNTHRDAYIPGTGARGTDIVRAADALVAGVTPILNVLPWTKLVGDMEVDAASTYGNLSKRPGLTNLDTANTGSTVGTYYMAGLAYWANTNDIRLDKPVRVKTFSIDVDERGNGLIEDTNIRSIKPRNSQFYLAAKYGGFLDKNKDGNPFKTFVPDSTTLVTNNNSEWASNGTDPDNYFLASDPAKMINAIHKIFNAATSSSGTISGVTLTSTKISTDSSYVYQPGFNPSKWGGSLLKLSLTLVDKNAANIGQPGYVPNNVVTLQDAAYPTWDAGLVLTGKPATTLPVAAAVLPNPLPASRNIYTATIGADKSLTTVEFKWVNLTAAQQGLLDLSPVSPYAADALGARRVDYLRGSRTDEIGQPNGIFRQRDRVMGDIINGNPTFVAAPAVGIQGTDYKTFYDNNKNRTKAVYVGANDGMLHAFDAADGHELFAYVPNALIAGLNQLTDQNYVHRPYVDGTLTVNEAYVSGNWKTILASGMGGGAQGAFVLDVTNPSNFASGAGAIWEFTDKDDPDMGNLTSPPLVAKFKTGGTATAPVYKYFVVIPNGFNNYKDDNGYKDAAGADACNPVSTTCNANAPGALFLLSLDKAAGAAWVRGTNYYKFTTPIKEATLQNGLSSPALVLGNDGAVKYAYAGDLQGNMWRFDFSGAAPWSGALPASGTPLFAAKGGISSNPQPITQQPKVVYAPGGGYVVLFGTGKYVENADAASGNFKTQSFYGIYDNGSNVSDRSKLALRTLTTDPTAGSDAVKITGTDFDYGSGLAKQGWYFDFLNSASTGERSVTNALVAYGKLYFNSLVTGTDPCASGGGRTYSMDALTGLPINADGAAVSGGITGQTSTVGMLNSPVLFETGTTVGLRDSIGKRIAEKKYSVFNFGTNGAAPATNGVGSFKPPAGRNSWREILNYQELRDAAN